jgi:hypothetical protein
MTEELMSITDADKNKFLEDDLYNARLRYLFEGGSSMTSRNTLKHNVRFQLTTPLQSW